MAQKWHIHEPSINPAPMNSGWSWEGLRWALSVATVFSATRRSVSPSGKSSRFCTSESRICKLSLDSAKVASRKCTKISARWHKDLWSHIIEPSLVWGVVFAPGNGSMDMSRDRCVLKCLDYTFPKSRCILKIPKIHEINESNSVKHCDSLKSSSDVCGFAVCHKAAWVEVPRWPWSSWKGAEIQPWNLQQHGLMRCLLLLLRDLVILRSLQECSFGNRRVDCKYICIELWSNAKVWPKF